MKMFVKYLLMFVVMLVFFACPDNPTVETPGLPDGDNSNVQPSIDMIVVRGNATVQEGYTTRLEAIVTVTGEANQRVTWLSSQPGLAHVDQNGVIYGLSVGNVVITARSLFDTNQYTEHSLEVIPVIPSVDLINIMGSSNVTINHRTQLMTFIIATGGANKAVTWSSSDTNTATVDANGVVTGIVSGNVTITARSVFNNTRIGTYNMTVIPFAVYGYRLTDATIDSGGGISMQLAEGHIRNGANTTDLLENVIPTGSISTHGSLENFNDGNEGQSDANSHLFHADGSTTNAKTIQVLGTNQLTASSGVFRIRVLFRNRFQDRFNGIVVTLLDKSGNSIGEESDALTGVRAINAHDGFVVDFRVSDGTVLTQPTIITIGGNEPNLPSP